MSWSRVDNSEAKPLAWWYHKVMCEFGYWIGGVIPITGIRMYCHHLNRCCDHGFDLYGKRSRSWKNAMKVPKKAKNTLKNMKKCNKKAIWSQWSV